MKGQISLIESILSAVVLFIAFNMIITVGEYQTKWKESLNSLEGKDILITSDRLGRLHDYSFSPTNFNSFLSRIDAIKDSIIKVETQGTTQNTIYIACDCTSEQITYIQNILNDVKFNKRGVIGTVCATSLPTINACGSGKSYPDVLVIWEYRSLGQNEINALINFAKDGNGVIEISDIDSTQVSDTAHQTVFGVKWITQGNFPNEQIQFLKPRNSSVVAYQPYKWFYHSPYTFTLTQDVATFQKEDGSIVTCNGKAGTFKFQDSNYKFWVCTDNKAYFDTNQPQNDKSNIENVVGDILSIAGHKFKLNYLDSTSKIRISFKPDYRFNDFLFVDQTHNKVYPSNDDKSRILLSMGYWDAQKETPVSAMILNKFENGFAVWLPDFGRNSGLPNTGDDHKQLLSSLIFSISNKYTKETFQQVGEITSYINVNNTDILEIYKVDLSIGKPF